MAENSVKNNEPPLPLAHLLFFVVFSIEQIDGSLKVWKPNQMHC